MLFGNEVADVLAVLRKTRKTYKDYLPEEAIRLGTEMADKVGGIWEGIREEIVGLVREEIPYEYPYVAVWWYSVLLGIRKESSIFSEFVSYIRKHEGIFSPNTLYFLYYQLSAMMFSNIGLNCSKNKVNLWKFFLEIVGRFEGYIDNVGILEELPIERRDRSKILVITEQFLVEEHGPTKTALDRCRAIIEGMGKDVLLINSAELLTRVGEIPFYGCCGGSYIPKRKAEKEQFWKGVRVPYYQCENNMPDIETVRQLLLDIRAMAPWQAVAIGSGGILGSLVGKIVPSISIGTVPSELAITGMRLQTLGRKLEKQDIEILSHMGLSEENVIESVFTSGLRAQTGHVTREELGIPEDTFLLAVVGGRLDNEVTEEFLEILGQIMPGNMCIGFFGMFHTYESRTGKFVQLRGKTRNFGFCEDMLSYMEVCDLYINPLRKGSGTSCVEALFKGVPVVTVDYGDVAVNAGELFCVGDYKGMQKEIMRYYSNKAYYQEMSIKARERAEVLLDTDTEFAKVMQEAEKRGQIWWEREARADAKV